MKTFIHVGFAKCGSTSLQEGLRNGTGVLFPEAGTNFPASEHISLPLFLIGIDNYTKQYISDKWVQEQHTLMMKQVNEAEQTVILSSKRLISINDRQIEILKSLFTKKHIEIIIIVRDLGKYFNSTWRHNVFYHDYAVDFQIFRETVANFKFKHAIQKFKKFFPVHVFNLDDKKIQQEIKYLTSANFILSKSNIGVSQKLASFLQQQHVQMGYHLFREIYTTKVNKQMKYFMFKSDNPELLKEYLI